jgi:glycosyltransferase involved in cell wall biosynthesis
MNNHKITVMFPINYLGVGGAERQLVELVKGIDKTRYKPIIVTLFPGGALDSEVQQIPGAQLISLNRNGKYDFTILNRMYTLLKRKEVDIIQPFLTPATFFSLLPSMPARTSVKIITERCGVRIKANYGHRIYQSIEDFFTRFADWVIPNSESGKNLLVKRGINPDRIKVIYNGINFERLVCDQAKIAQIQNQIKQSSDDKIVGITASLTPAKDHVTFLRGAKLIHQAMPKTRFAILGDGPLRQDLENLTIELDIKPYVTFLGNQREVGSYVSTFDVFCLSSIDHEGCSNATLEAMYLEKPVVVTDLGGNREVVAHDETGLIVPVRSPEALADGVLAYLKQPDKARIMGNNAKKSVITRFSLPRMIHNYEQLYEQAMQQKSK